MIVQSLRIRISGRDHIERVESRVERSEESERGVGVGEREETVSKIGGGDSVPEEIVVGETERGFRCGELLFEREGECGRD